MQVYILLGPGHSIMMSPQRGATFPLHSLMLHLSHVLGQSVHCIDTTHCTMLHSVAVDTLRRNVMPVNALGNVEIDFFSYLK